MILASFALAGLVLMAAGCAFEGQIVVQIQQGAPVVMKQQSQVAVAPNRVKGTTTHAGQVARIDCSVTGTFDVREATGTAILVQTYVVHLRTRPLPRGTPYEIDCGGPVVAQLPSDAADVSATATDESGSQSVLAAQAPRTAIPLALGKRLRAQSGTQFALLSWPAASAGSYRMEMSFTLANARPFREKVVYAASITCGRSKYFQPIRPLVTSMAGVSAFTIQPSAGETGYSTPHLFGGIRSYGEVTRTLSCAR